MVMIIVFDKERGISNVNGMQEMDDWHTHANSLARDQRMFKRRQSNGGIECAK